MECPTCGHTMNRHAEKMLLESLESAESGTPVIVAYSCQHCGTNASRISHSDQA